MEFIIIFIIGIIFWFVIKYLSLKDTIKAQKQTLEALTYEYNNDQSQLNKTKEFQNNFALFLENKKNQYEKKENEIEIKYQNLRKIMKEALIGYPTISKAIAEHEALKFYKWADYLATKKNPAYSAADHVRMAKNEIKELVFKNKVLEYKINYYESMFPDLTELSDDEYGFEKEQPETIDKENPERKWLSKEEFSQLNSTQRSQLALNRYIEGRKSNWQIGRDYEQFVGYTLEEEGYNVEYCGMQKKLEDMGRDLICYRGKDTMLVQCKYWSKQKLIHEKHIFQLYGTMILYKLANPKTNVTARIITSTFLSEVAKNVAKELNIAYIEANNLGVYPRIKCNISQKDKEKIYHLPFDQQYDRIIIDKKAGEKYVSTVAEAEEAGFRRAKKHFNGN